MATEQESSNRFERKGGRFNLGDIKSALFELLLIGSTLFGIVALLILFGYIAFDGLQPTSASALWYLLYFGTLVAPTAAFTLYARRNPAVRAANAKAYAAVFGTLTLALLIYVVAQAVSPYDLLIYMAFGGIPPVAIYLYGQRNNKQMYTGPAIPVSIIGGLGVAAVTYAFIRPIIGIAAGWIAYYGIVTLPVAAVIGAHRMSRESKRDGLIAGGTVLGIGIGVIGASLAIGQNPSLWLVLFSVFVAPTAYVLGETVRTNPEGRIGVLGPFVLTGGVLAGAIIERQLAIDGLEPFLTPTLLLDSWNGQIARQAGVYPQIVGSIIIVGLMAVLTFPIGVGAAVYLEEYAPEDGWRGRFASILEVNISNLAGVPSVVYGLLGLALFRNTLGFGTGIVVSAAGTLGLLILPIVVVSTQEAFRSVPNSLRDASYGMGASRWQTVRNVVLPEAIPGTLTGTILALARAIGETAPLVIIAVATTTYSAPSGLFGSATALPLQIYAAKSNVQEAFRHGVVPAAAIVLLVLMLLMNATAIVIRNRYSRES